MKVLIIEDEKDLVAGISRGLQKNGFLTDAAYDGQEGYRLICQNHYDCVLLDLNIPMIDGLTLLQKVRETDQNTKILILSARSDVEDKVRGLGYGADDYLAKPFYFIELLARIQNLVKRQYTAQAEQITVGSLFVDTRARIVTLNNENLSLTALEYRILEFLAVYHNQYKSAEEIIEHVWQSDPSFFSNSLKVHLSSLRKKMALLDNKTYIHCKKGIGYRLSDQL